LVKTIGRGGWAEDNEERGSIRTCPREKQKKTSLRSRDEKRGWAIITSPNRQSRGRGFGGSRKILGRAHKDGGTRRVIRVEGLKTGGNISD